MNLNENIEKLTNFIDWIIFDVFEPEIQTDAARQRIHNKLQAGPPNSETPADNTPKMTPGRGRGVAAKSKVKVTTEVLKSDVKALVEKTKK